MRTGIWTDRSFICRSKPYFHCLRSLRLAGTHIDTYWLYMVWVPAERRRNQEIDVNV